MFFKHLCFTKKYTFYNIIKAFPYISRYYYYYYKLYIYLLFYIYKKIYVYNISIAVDKFIKKGKL